MVRRPMVYLLPALFLVSISAACADLSTPGTWGTMIVNVSDVLYVNENVALCGGTYYLNAAVDTPVIKLNSSGIYLDCNQSILDGVDKGGYGIMAENLEYNTVENCTVRNYEWGIYLLTSNHSMVAFNTAHNNTEHGIKFQMSNNNTAIHNLAYNNTVGGGIQFDSSTFNNASNNTAFGNSYGIISLGNNNNVVNNTAYNSTYAFVIAMAQYNRVENNTAYDSGVGYLITGGENNTIVNNVAYDITGDGAATGFGFFNSVTFGSANLNNYSNNTAHDCQSYGFNINKAHTIYFRNNSAYNNSEGVFFYANNSQVIGNRAYNNSAAGIYLIEANNNNVSDNIAYDNAGDGFAGIEVWGGSYNTLTNNTAYNNVYAGIYLVYDADFNNVSSSISYGNANGFSILSSNNSIIYNITAYDNTGAGFTLGSGSFNAIINSSSYNNTNYGYQISSGYANNTIIGSSAYGENQQYGFYSFGSSGNNFTGCSAYANYIGFVLSLTSFNNIISNSVGYNNTQQGFWLGDTSINNTLINNTAYNNTFGGITVSQGSTNNTIIDSTIFSNYYYGIQLGPTASDNNITNAFIYNQTYYVMQTPTAGEQNNFTNLTIGYNETIGWINFPFINTSDMDLVMNYALPSLGTVFIQPDFVSLRDTYATQANVSAIIKISTDNCSKGVLKEYGFPVTLADILDTGVHYPTTLACVDGVATFDVLGFSGYALGEETTYLSLFIQPDSTVVSGTETNVSCNASNSEANLTLYRDGVAMNSSFSYVQEIATLPVGTYFYECNASGNGNYSNATVSGTLTVSSCTNISSPMTYTLTSDMSGYRTYGFTNACVYINSSNVTLDCDGHSIIGGGAQYGVYVYSSYSNVSIQGCSVSNYTDGIVINSDYSTVTNNDLFNNTEAGLIAYGTGINFSNNLFHNNTVFGLSINWNENRVFNNSMYDSPAGTGLYLASAYNVVFNNTIFGNLFGAYFNSASYSNFSENEVANNSWYGLYLLAGFPSDAYNIITKNNIANNSLFQIGIGSSFSNLIYNNIVNASGAQGVIESNTYEFWNISKTLGTNMIGGAYIGGNFYSNYTGFDTDGDGLGNTPYITNTYSSTATQDAYSSQQASTGTWTNFANTYDQDWDTYGTLADTAEGYYNFTIPAGASTAFALISIKAGGVGGVGVSVTDSVPVGTLFGTDCLSTDPLQVKAVGWLNKGVVKVQVYCWDYTGGAFVQASTVGAGDVTGVDLYELNATFQITSTSNSIDYLPLTNNLNYAPNITLMSIGGQGNGGEITSLTPDIVFNATDLDNSTLNCTVYVDSITPGGTNDTVENGTLTTITLSYSLTAGQTYSFTVNCTDNTTISASGAWTETVAGGSTTRSSSNPSENEPLSIIAEDEVPLETVMQITVEREGHVTLPGVFVTISFAGDTVFTGYTDSWGHVLFTPENAGTYRIAATKLGYVAANDSFTAFATECASSNDCAYDKACTDGLCTQVPEGECGTYSNHAWEDYACCAGSDCGEGFSCTNHECVQRPEQPEGCTIDTQCRQGYRCASGTCVPETTPPECVEDGDCQAGFRCSANVCVEVPTTPGGNATGPGEPLRPTTQGGIGGAILNLWWLWLILIALVAWYFYRKSRENKA